VISSRGVRARVEPVLHANEHRRLKAEDWPATPLYSFTVVRGIAPGVIGAAPD
jgi:hypothetical protein